jgi:hypothetical protein
MIDYRLPDGTWVTSPICVGNLTTNCVECTWEDKGPVQPANEECPIAVQPQRCTRCGWLRFKYAGNPHPEDGNDGHGT